MKNLNLRRGDVVIVNLDGAKDHEKQGIRPAVIISNEIMNESSNNIIVAPMTSAVHKKRLLPSHVLIVASEYSGLNRDSVVQLEDVRSISKNRVINHIGCLTKVEVDKVDTRIGTVFFNHL